MTSFEDETVWMCAELIRIDTSNSGDGRGPGERAAAERVMEWLAAVGLTPLYLESAPRRGNVILRVPGRRPDLPALLVHGHLDVVPADPRDWRFPPLSGELVDGHVWGRGAVDMKHMDAMMVAVVRHMTRRGEAPRRDLVFAWLADEEMGGDHGARFLVDKHPGLFEGCAEAISEVGGYSVEVDPALRLYLVETAQKGLAWLRLAVEGRAGHGSLLHPDNAVTELATAVSRIGAHSWPRRLTPTTRRMMRDICDACGVPFDEDDLDATLGALGPVSRVIGASLSHVSNPTQFHAGYATNVVPAQAVAEVDGRFLPGLRDEFLATLDRLAGPRVSREHIDYEEAIEAPFDTPLVESMLAALRREDPAACVVPYCSSAGTDNRTFHRMGIHGYGFVPLQLPPEMDFGAMFHGVDERVPESALRFGARVLHRLLSTY
ncbi:M20/M25/M40 family metallo-hydrolase [Sphaerisporangium sp. TRM90804]|uniref:M20/M25/M40 family metallo-hydrolase n=1 Tax=Sphaerisporangium sp. TRM90804 TaxID=3031113 RepID=UPI00244A1F67|nr:M20/M25/M40 family metallo-hydrolase [Sphaerisporangium sp. TRM90804]MDH2426782.1 M20/M25/M40 family metallo-hydrolase [Sphaerisporangium sp. TRM90804]